MQIWGSERWPGSRQYRKGGGAGSSHDLEDIEGFSVHPTSNEWKGKPVDDFQQGGERKQSDFCFCLCFLLDHIDESNWRKARMETNRTIKK